VIQAGADLRLTRIARTAKHAKSHEPRYFPATRSKPGVTSTIIGARRTSQLEDNVKALALKLRRRT